MPAAVLGLLSHYGILFVAAALYLAASRRFPLLRHRAVICGLVFGVGVYLFMNFVVVPLSAVPFEFSYTPSKLAQGFLSHSVLVGLPIALAIRRYSPTEVAVMSDVAFQPMEGTCSCRGVRYRMTAAPLFVHCCHCTWCQRETGSAFVLNAMVEAECVEVLAGSPLGGRHAVEQRARPEDHALPQVLRRAVEQLPGRRRCDPLRAHRYPRGTQARCLRTSTFTHRPSSRGWSCRPALGRCRSSTIRSRNGRRRAWHGSKRRASATA